MHYHVILSLFSPLNNVLLKLKLLYQINMVQNCIKLKTQYYTTIK